MFSSFTQGLTLITLSELGDKTFFIAMILAMRHPRRWVLIGVTFALAAMTIISVLIGNSIAIFGKDLIQKIAVALFLGFGLKLLYDGWKMPSINDTEEIDSACAEVEKAEHKLGNNITPLTIIIEAFTLTFVAEWGDRTQFSTITLAAANNPLGVTLGAILGHIICALIAVIGGKAIAGRISEKILTILGGILFIICGIVLGREI